MLSLLWQSPGTARVATAPSATFQHARLDCGEGALDSERVAVQHGDTRMPRTEAPRPRRHVLPLTTASAGSTIDWLAEWARLQQLDGTERDVEAKRLDARWKADYVDAFVTYARKREGWSRERAEIWAGGMVDHALATYRGAATPVEAATVDVRDREWGNDVSLE